VNEKRCRPPLPEAEVKTIVEVSVLPVKPTGKIEFESTQTSATTREQIELPDIRRSLTRRFLVGYSEESLLTTSGEAVLQNQLAIRRIHDATADGPCDELHEHKGVRIEYKNFPLSIFLLLVDERAASSRVLLPKMQWNSARKWELYRMSTQQLETLKVRVWCLQSFN